MKKYIFIIAGLLAVSALMVTYMRTDNLAAGLQNDISKFSLEYKRYLGVNYFDFSFVVDNIVNRNKCYKSSEHFSELREECVRNNMVRLLKHFPSGKYYGQWGLEHTYLSDHGGQFSSHDCLATFLNKKYEPTKCKVISIAYFYSNCQQMTWGKNYGQEKYKKEIQDDLLSKVSKADLCLLKFTGSNSPFNKKPYFVAYPKGGSTTDYYQYAILIKNSPAAHPFDNPGKESQKFMMTHNEILAQMADRRVRIEDGKLPSQ